MTTITDMPALCPAEGVCPNLECPASGRMGVHAHQERRYICHACKTTFAAPTASPLFGLKTPQWVVLIVLTLLVYGCPVPAIVAAFGLDERAVATWLKKAGAHAKAVQEELVCSGQVDLGPVQGEELYVKHQAGTVWMAMAMSVFSRLWLWGAVSPQRTTAVTPRSCSSTGCCAARPAHPLGDRWRCRLGQQHPVCVPRPPTDRQAGTTAVGGVGRSAYHPGHQAGHQASGQGSQTNAQLWQSVCRRSAGAGYAGGRGVFTPASIERLRGTFRTGIRPLTRRSRTPARDVAQVEAAMVWRGVVYTFCRVHRSLDASPAMAADRTDHVWSIRE